MILEKQKTPARKHKNEKAQSKQSKVKCNMTAWQVHKTV